MAVKVPGFSFFMENVLLRKLLLLSSRVSTLAEEDRGESNPFPRESGGTSCCCEDAVAESMEIDMSTFTTLCSIADWSTSLPSPVS